MWISMWISANRSWEESQLSSSCNHSIIMRTHRWPYGPCLSVACRKSIRISKYMTLGQPLSFFLIWDVVELSSSICLEVMQEWTQLVKTVQQRRKWKWKKLQLQLHLAMSKLDCPDDLHKENCPFLALEKQATDRWTDHPTDGHTLI